MVSKKAKQDFIEFLVGLFNNSSNYSHSVDYNNQLDFVYKLGLLGWF